MGLGTCGEPTSEVERPFSRFLMPNSRSRFDDAGRAIEQRGCHPDVCQGAAPAPWSLASRDSCRATGSQPDVISAFAAASFVQTPTAQPRKHLHWLPIRCARRTT